MAEKTKLGDSTQKYLRNGVRYDILNLLGGFGSLDLESLKEMLNRETSFLKAHLDKLAEFGAVKINELGQYVLVTDLEGRSPESRLTSKQTRGGRKVSQNPQGSRPPTTLGRAY